MKGEIEWIPVTESMPPEDVDVLVAWVDNIAGQKISVMAFSQTWDRTGDESWCMDEWIFDGKRLDIDVTHWAHLPQFPETKP